MVLLFLLIVEIPYDHYSFGILNKIDFFMATSVSFIVQVFDFNL